MSGWALDRWGEMCGVPRRADESDADYRARIVAVITKPPRRGEELPT